jgi:histidinol-phosphate aminotransferase
MNRKMIRKKATRVVFLDRNESQYGPAPACYVALKHADQEILSVYSRDFTRGVKSSLSERLAADYGINEKRIILGYGSEDILKQVVQCYLGKGDKIMIPSHSWWYYKKIASEVEGVNLEYPIVEGKDSFEYDIDAMLKQYDDHEPALVLISSPNNPTGNCMGYDQIKQVLRHFKQSIIVLDEAYAFFNGDNSQQVRELIEEFPKIIVIRTFSKYFGLAGIRSGFAFMGSQFDRLSLFSARYLGFNRLSEQIALAALDSKDYYEKMRSKMVADRDMFFNEFNRLPGFKAYKSYANFMLVKIPPEVNESLKKYLTERNMIIKFMDEEVLVNHVRITIGTRAQNHRLIKLVKEFMKEHRG